MSKPKHTSGPWVYPKEHGNAVYPQRNWESQQLGELKEGMQVLIYPCDTRETEANARLIAAAPELLEALKKMTGFHQSNIDDNPNHGYSSYAQQEVEKAWVAIAKAEGRDE